MATYWLSHSLPLDSSRRQHRNSRLRTLQASRFKTPRALPSSRASLARMAEDSFEPYYPRSCRLILTSIPPEILLYILSFLDVPELSTLSSTSGYLATLAADPILQRTRLLVVAPSRLSHSLFGIGPEGLPLRPTVSDLIRRGVMKGLDIERRWRAGLYLYSAPSVANYEISVLLQRGHASNVVSSKLRRWSLHPNPLKALYKTHVLPDVESSSPLFSRSLLPVVRRLKWSIQRDELSKVLRLRTVTTRESYLTRTIQYI